MDFAEVCLTKAKKSPLKGAFLKWCAILCEYRTENYDDYKQLEYKLERFSDYDEDMNTKDLQLKILEI